MDRVQDEYTRRSYSRFEEEEDDEDYAPQDGYYRGGEGANEEEGVSSDATEGHDEEDEIYEGEYQGIPRQESLKGGERLGSVAAAGAFDDSEGQRRKDREELAQQYELILQECGHGRFQWTLYFVLGLALMADGVEVFVVGFVLPSAEKDMCLSDSNKGIIGGSIPIVFSYFSEFLAQEKRGEHLSWLCMFWMIGGIYASAMAWAIIPHYGWSFQMGSAYQFHSWRVFVLVCAFPSVFAIGALTTMPESPRFYLENGKHDEAWMVLKQVHDTNMRAKGHPERVFSVTHIKTIKREDELIEIQSDTGTWYRRWLVRCLNLSQQVWSNFQQCFVPEYRRVTLMMMAVWFTMSFSYYGLTVWFPDMIKHLQSIEYASRTKLFTREKVRHFTFNFTLENQVHRGGEYFNDKFIGLKMKSVIFEDSLFDECYFEDITSSNTFFKNCTFISTVFYNTDLFEYKFINSRLLNSTFLHNKEGCQLDFSDDNNAYMIYFVSFLGTLAVLPGNIVSALLMDKIGRLRMLAGSSVMSCVSCFFLSFGNSESAMIALLCLFGGVSIASWNALDVLTVELYPSDKRTTAFGFLNALCKLAAVLGISIFTSFVGITKAVPILFASAALALGSSLALKLPETRGQVLQ
uniref:Synaptic vesicle glycoprotein 2A n=1 Tax=Zosterops lateralis melanops TaxID=1220523 RepID=A0A8D2Q147_ZOSLA